MSNTQIQLVLEYLEQIHNSLHIKNKFDEMPKTFHDSSQPNAKELDEMYKEIEEAYEDYKESRDCYFF